MDQVLYYNDPKTGETKLNVKDAPIDPPHPNLKFKRYIFSGDGKQVSAFFAASDAAGKAGSRCSRPSGGVNKEFFDGMKECKSEEDRWRYKVENAGKYQPRHERFGPLDPEI